jgi:hypothetical protein
MVGGDVFEIIATIKDIHRSNERGSIDRNIVCNM